MSNDTSRSIVPSSNTLIVHASKDFWTFASNIIHQWNGINQFDILIKNKLQVLLYFNEIGRHLLLLLTFSLSSLLGSCDILFSL